MKNYILLLSFLLTYSLFSKADDVNYESKFEPICPQVSEIISNEFKSELNSKHGTAPLASYNSFGIRFKEDFNAYIDTLKTSKITSRNFKRSANGNVFLDLVTNEILEDKNKNLKPETEILKINGRSTSEMTDAELMDFHLNHPETFDIEYIDRDVKNVKSINLEKIPLNLMYVYFDLKEDLISEINSKDSSHKANISLYATYFLYKSGFPFVKKIQDLYKKLEDNGQVFSSNGFACTFHGDEAFSTLGLYNPDYQLSNQTNNLSEIAAERTYVINYNNDPNNPYLWVVKMVDYKELVFKNNFKFNSFPFDSQNLKYSILLQGNGRNIIPIPDSTSFYFLDNVNKVDLNEWEHFGADYKIIKEFDGGYDNYKLTFFHTIERNYSYYISKIILPIIIILFISWSVFWIHPKELEARLTVSIVCLLSLIAYTFIIDKDIPKLSYLTLMDYIVLISYFFSVIPTMQTIFVHNYISLITNHLDIDDAKKIDKVTRKIVPLSYVIFILIIFAQIITSSPNTIKGMADFIN